MKYQVGDLIWDKDCLEWGVICSYDGYSYGTIWTKSRPQSLMEMDFLDLSFEFYAI